MLLNQKFNYSVIIYTALAIHKIRYKTTPAAITLNLMIK
jgi:hypothetical protein